MATASDGPHRPNQRCAVAKIYLEATDLKDNATTAERRTRIDPKIDPKLVGAIDERQCGFGSPTRARTWDLRINRPALHRSVSAINLSDYLTCARSIFAEMRRVVAPYGPLVSLNRPEDSNSRRQERQDRVTRKTRVAPADTALRIPPHLACDFLTRGDRAHD